MPSVRRRRAVGVNDLWPVIDCSLSGFSFLSKIVLKYVSTQLTGASNICSQNLLLFNLHAMYENAKLRKSFYSQSSRYDQILSTLGAFVERASS